MQMTTLDNRLRVLTCDFPHANSVSIHVLVGAGSRYETSELAGVSHLLEHLIIEATAKYPDSYQVIEEAGACLQGTTEPAVTSFTMQALKENYRQPLDVLLDMLLHPVLDPAIVEREKEIALEELRDTDDPEYQERKLGMELLYPASRLGDDVGGTAESVPQLQVSDLRDFWRHQYNPNNVVIGVAGAVDHAEVVDLIAKRTEGWKPGPGLSYKRIGADFAKHRAGPIVKQVDKESYSTVRLGLTLPVFSRHDPDWPALIVLDQILCVGMGSRLSQVLRRDAPLVYDFSSEMEVCEDSGYYSISVGVDPEVDRQVLGKVVKCLSSMRDWPPDVQELRRGKAQAKSAIIMETENHHGLAYWYAEQVVSLVKVETPEEHMESIEEVSAEDVFRVAARLIKPTQFLLGVVGSSREDHEFVDEMNNSAQWNVLDN